MPPHTFGKGRAALESLEKASLADGRLVAMLQDWHRLDCLEAGYPVFDEEAAWWGARMFTRVSWLYLDRASAAADASDLLREEMPGGDRATAHFSADLALRWLPDLHVLARAASPEDPLIEQMRLLGRRAPLSGIGIPWLAEGEKLEGIPHRLAIIQSDAGIWRLLIDRVIERRDREKLTDPAIAESVAVALGAFPRELADGFLDAPRP